MIVSAIFFMVIFYIINILITTDINIITLVVMIIIIIIITPITVVILIFCCLAYIKDFLFHLRARFESEDFESNEVASSQVSFFRNPFPLFFCPVDSGAGYLAFFSGLPGRLCVCVLIDILRRGYL